MHPSALFAFVSLIAAPIVLGSYAPYNDLDTRGLSPEDVAQIRARHVAETILDALDRRWLKKAETTPKTVDNTVHPEGHGLVRAKPLNGGSGVGHPKGHKLVRAKPIGGGKGTGSAAHPEGHGLVRAKPLSSYVELKSRTGDSGYPEGHRLVRAKPVRGGRL